MNQKIPVWKTIRFTLGNLTQNSWMYLRNSIFLQFFISEFGFGFLTLIFRGMLFITGQSNLNFANFKTVLLSPGSITLVQDCFIKPVVHSATHFIFTGIRVSYFHGVLDTHLHDLRNDSRHSFFMAQ